MNTSPHRLRAAIVPCLVLAIVCGIARASAAEPIPTPVDDTSVIGKVEKETRHKSEHLGGEVVVLPGVFHPIEAEILVLPFMKENAKLFAGKRVLEIGSGSGVVSVYAAKLGAKHVVSTDISEQAVATTKLNAERFGVGDVVEPRLVPASDVSAYSVIKPDEQFDVIISNPPYSLDLDAPKNDAVTDTGDLGFSIVRGLDQHLAPDGKVILLYGSMFYHLTMVKFGRYQGYEVRYHRPLGLTEWESEALFNSYLGRLLAREKVDPKAFRFSNHDPGIIAGTFGDPKDKHVKPLFPGNSNRYYPGMMVMERRSPERPAPSAAAPH